jgi:hypothetical protein
MEVPIATKGRSAKAKRAAPNSPWITHVKSYAAERKVKYGQALVDPGCSESYKASKANVVTPK